MKKEEDRKAWKRTLSDKARKIAQDFGPWKLTPERALKELKEGVDIYPSIIDAYPVDQQIEFEGVRGDIIRKEIKPKKRKSPWADLPDNG